MRILILQPKKSLNKAYLKEKVTRQSIELFKENFKTLLSKINTEESEEHLKNLVSDFLKNTWYKDLYEINTKDRNDLVIHTGKNSKTSVGVLFEVKKPSNKSEMITSAKPNSKAMHELLLYYLRERHDHSNIDIKYLVATNIYEWYIFDEVWFEKNVFRNIKLKNDFDNWKLSGNDTRFFYENIARQFFNGINEDIPCTYFDIREYEKTINNAEIKDDTRLISLYKVLSPPHLLKQSFGNDSNSLDTKFYIELLHIMGLEERKDAGKKIIQRKVKPDEASFLENTIIKLEDGDKLSNLQDLFAYGKNRESQLFNLSLELCLTWINRILFMKLLEAQLYKYQKGNKDYLFLNSEIIFDFDELSNLFFQVLAERNIDRRTHLKQKFANVPYLNSSLFDRTDLERSTFDISALDNRLTLPIHPSTVLKDEKGNKLTGQMTTLKYLFEFLNAYDFTSEGSEEIQEENKNLINASVLGLIFEKINGYKDGSYFTPGFITMFMSKETIRKAVVQKFNENYKIECDTFEDLKNFIAGKFKAKEIQEYNRLVNTLRICDPSVGSGHFLVSALNEIIAVKAELGILCDSEGVRLGIYEFRIENDELIITYNDNTEIYEYSITNGSVNKEIQRLQETIFHEKQTIIENCLFGVDINPNSVKICRLRLWIELLKSAYYTKESNYKELETLPNIDINIKTGNSLISRFALDADLSKALKSVKWNIESYKGLVHDYQEATSKEVKKGLLKLIDDIKKDFRSEIGLNDPKILKLSKLKGELTNRLTQPQLFDIPEKEKKKIKKEIETFTNDIRKLELEIEEIKNNKIYENAFEWRFEFPEVLDNDGNYIGFDAIIGNPPYVQLQKMGSDADALQKMNFDTFVRTGDIYALFYEKGFQILKQNGLLNFITSNKWMRAEYGKELRNFFIQKCNPLLLVDFGGIQVFDEATVDTNILMFQKCEYQLKTEVCLLQKDFSSINNLSDYFRQNATKISFNNDDSWVVLEPIEQQIKEKIERIGTPLKNWDINIYRGILTGYNEAFIISQETRDKLIAASPKNDEIIRPILRGRDIHRYYCDTPDQWIIFIPWHFPLHENGKIKGASLEAEKMFEKEYPEIYNHLLYFKNSLENRNKAETGIRYEWYALQRYGANYWREFEKTKIVWGNLSLRGSYSLADKGVFINAPSTFIPTDNLYLLALLNSKIADFYIKQLGVTRNGGYFEYKPMFVEQLPIPNISKEEEIKFTDLVKHKLESNTKDTSEIDLQLENLVCELFELTSEERDFVYKFADSI